MNGVKEDDKEKDIFVYKFTKNPNPIETYKKLEELFGKGYILDKKHPTAKEKSTRAKIRNYLQKI